MLDKTLELINSPYISYEQYFQEYVLSVADKNILHEVQVASNQINRLKDVDMLISKIQAGLQNGFKH